MVPIFKISPVLTSFSMSTGPKLLGANEIIAFMADMALTMSSRAMIIPVRTAGRPSFDRLKHFITLSSHIGVASVKIIDGNGTP